MTSKEEVFLRTLLLGSMVRNAGSTTNGVSNEIRLSEEFKGIDWDSIATMDIKEGIIFSYRRWKAIHSCVIVIDKDLGLRVIGEEIVI